MGRKTFHLYPRALPNRRNIESKTEKDFKGCEVYTSLDEAMRHISTDEQAFIIGGAPAYIREALGVLSRLYLAGLQIVAGDVFFPHL